LVKTTMVLPDNSWLSFDILSAWDIENLLVLSDIDELVSSVLEDLEPLWVGAPDLHLVGLTSWFDVPWLVVKLGLDCEWLLVEPPDLSLVTVWSLND
jgi:hypothetical protein